VDQGAGEPLRILVACGAAGGIAATFNAPVTGVSFGVEIILREFSVDALFTVMLSAMIADVIAIPFLGDRPFLSGFPAGIMLHHPRNYLLVAVLAVLAALLGLAFKTVLYKIEDLCDLLWQGRPEWARPAVGGVVLGLHALARQIGAARTETAQAQVSADRDHAYTESLLVHPPAPLAGYRVIEIAVTAGSPAAGQKMGTVPWPPDSTRCQSCVAAGSGRRTLI
jgi:H+/Cl- antiporter ClcA